MKHQYQDGTLCLYFEGEFDNLSVMKLKEPSASSSSIVPGC